MVHRKVCVLYKNWDFVKHIFAMSSGVGCHKLASLAIFAMAQSKKCFSITKV